MRDLVERLRDAARDMARLLDEAADEIDRLHGKNNPPLVDSEFLDHPLREVHFGKGHTARVHSLYRLEYCENEMRCIPIVTIRDLVQMTEHEIIRCANVGRATVERVKAVLAEHGLHLGMVMDAVHD